MRRFAAWWAGAVCLGLAACASPPLPGDQPPQRVLVNGEPLVLSQITASTWTVTTPGEVRLVSGNPPGKAAMVEAIEKTSGCKVTDSDFSRYGRQFDAQVDCAGRVKN